MKYFKYIIILILLLICGLLYIQLDDYDNISNSLLDENTKTKEEMKQLSSSINDIKEDSIELQQKINILYAIIDAKEIEIELLEENCLKDETALEQPLENTPKDSKITLENENEVTGFE